MPCMKLLWPYDGGLCIKSQVSCCVVLQSRRDIQNSFGGVISLAWVTCYHTTYKSCDCFLSHSAGIFAYAWPLPLTKDGISQAQANPPPPPANTNQHHYAQAAQAAKMSGASAAASLVAMSTSMLSSGTGFNLHNLHAHKLELGGVKSEEPKPQAGSKGEAGKGNSGLASTAGGQGLQPPLPGPPMSAMLPNMLAGHHALKRDLPPLDDKVGWLWRVVCTGVLYGWWQGLP